MVEFNLKSFDDLNISCIEAKCESPKAIIQIIHGMAEHKERYIPIINYLNKNGYSVYISDNRGHGKSINDKYVLGNTGTPEDLINDQLCFTKYIKNINPDKKIILLGHSMGTLITRGYLMKNDDLISGVILSGTVCLNGAANLAVSLAKGKVKNKGELGSSKLLFALSNNFSFKKDFSWLSYNQDNIDKYEADPLCGYEFTNKGYLTLFTMVKMLNDIKGYECKNPNLPIRSFSGADDRTTGGTKGLNGVVKVLNKCGYINVKFVEYPKMKHEIFNEDECEAVFKDVCVAIEEML